jgi:TPR repeat protein
MMMPEDGIHLAIVNHPESDVATVSAPSARCLRCAADLSRMPEEGRYCPRCGLDSYSSPPAAILSRAAESRLAGQSDELGWGHLAELAVSSSTVVPPTVIPSPNTSSQILRGYANALYKLGRRYEVGGWTRNPREAIRCYLKAARLGNMMAFARLATRWIERCDRMAKAPPTDISPTHDTGEPIS